MLAVAILATGWVHARMDTASRIERGGRFVPKPAQAELSSFGFDALVADYFWLQAVQIVGGAQADVSQRAELLGRLVDVVTTVDPWVDHPYRFAAVWLTGSIDQVRQANRLLERGVAYHPKEWRNRFYLGFNHFFYLENDARAAEILESTLALEGHPPYLGALVARLRAGRGGLETAAAILTEMAREEPDPYAQAQYLKALDEIETERRARFLDAARVEFWRRHGRDVARAEELWNGPRAVLPPERVPAAHPHHPGFTWVLDEASGQIVSSYYEARYGVHFHQLDLARRERWRAELEKR